MRVVRGYDEDQYPVLTVPIGWSREQVLANARPVHERLGHTADIHEWGGGMADLWLMNPDGFSDYAKGVPHERPRL